MYDAVATSGGKQTATGLHEKEFKSKYTVWYTLKKRAAETWNTDGTYRAALNASPVLGVG